MIPLAHDFTDATVLVFGGGTIGARRSRLFAREASVVVVSPTFTDGAFGDAQLIRAAPDPDPDAIGDWIDRFSPALVIAATDDEAVNEAIVEAAQTRNLMTNRVDRAAAHDPRDVAVPATIRDGPVVVSISTDGTAPALSKYLRQELEPTLDGVGEMAEVAGAIRTELRERGVPPKRRHRIVTDVVNSPEHWTALRTGTANAREVIADVLDQSHTRSGGSL